MTNPDNDMMEGYIFTAALKLYEMADKLMHLTNDERYLQICCDTIYQCKNIIDAYCDKRTSPYKEFD